MNRVQNKVALITGGTRGMGASHARLLVDEGAKVVIGDVLDDEGELLSRQLGSAARLTAGVPSNPTPTKES